MDHDNQEMIDRLRERVEERQRFIKTWQGRNAFPELIADAREEIGRLNDTIVKLQEQASIDDHSPNQLA